MASTPSSCASLRMLSDPTPSRSARAMAARSTRSLLSGARGSAFESVCVLISVLPYLMRVIGFGLRAPRHPVRGRELAGRVEAVGKDVTRFLPGDEVMGIGEGSFAEYAAVREDKLARKPANLSFEQAAAVPISASTAIQALRKGRLQPGQKSW